MAQSQKDSAIDRKENLESALKLNRQMQLQLLMVKDKIEKLIKNVQEIYSSNETLMRTGMQTQRRKGYGMRGAYLRGGTFYLKGNMFFKDFDCRNCPDNPDYKQRKANNEMFPMDLELQARHLWSLKDKKGVVEGIKEQIVENLKDCGHDAKNECKELNSEKLVKLLQMVRSDFQIDWEQISQYNLQHRHSPKSCEAIWNVYLHPTLKRSKWTEKENLKLLEIVQKYNCQDWIAIANEIGNRSDFQCFVQYQNYVCYMTSEKSNKWTKEDDALLIEVIERNTTNGIINWSNVMVHFPQKPRTTLQCRYSYTLSPNINHEPFTPEEDLLLLASVKEYGTKFSSFPRTLFPNRTTVQLRSRYRNTLVHRHKQKSWTLDDDNKLIQFVSQHGTKSWKKCEEFIENHSRISCRTRYLVVSRFFKQNPDATLSDLPRKKQKEWNYVNTQNWTEKLMELTENPNAKLVTKVRKTIEKRSTEKDPKNKPEKKKREKKPIDAKPNKKPEKKKRVKKAKEKPKKSVSVKAENITESPVTGRRKPLYLNRLRSNSIALYHSFKYAYDVQVGQDRCSSLTASKCTQLNFVRQILQLFKLPPEVKNYRFDYNVPQQSRDKINNALRQDITYQLPSGFSLPPSWSTCIGFRALCIHSAQSDLQNAADDESDFDNTNSHIQLFRQRLRSLFYSTALLSRLHPSMVGIGKPLKEENQTNCALKRKQSFDNITPPTTPTPESSESQSPPPIANKNKRKKLVQLSAIDQVLNIKREKMDI